MPMIMIMLKKLFTAVIMSYTTGSLCMAMQNNKTHDPINLITSSTFMPPELRNIIIEELLKFPDEGDRYDAFKAFKELDTLNTTEDFKDILTIDRLRMALTNNEIPHQQWNTSLFARFVLANLSLKFIQAFIEVAKENNVLTSLILGEISQKFDDLPTIHYINKITEYSEDGTIIGWTAQYYV